MHRSARARPAGLAVLLLVILCDAARAQFPPDAFTNLQVLPKDITQSELIDVMAGFTRALGVRCTHCHVGDPAQPLATYRFDLDEKPAKRKARAMLAMVQAINQDHLSKLDSRNDPPVRVECVTCHRGTTAPRILSDALLLAYTRAGIDSVFTAYRALRQRYYGRATFDFGEVPLADVGARLWDDGQPADAVRLHALNVEMNPASAFAKRQHASFALSLEFRERGTSAGTRLYRDLRVKYGVRTFPESLLNGVGYRLLAGGQAELAIAAFLLNAQAFPQSANAHDSLGEAYERNGERHLAVQSYEKALVLDPASGHALRRLQELRR
jgi:tetratricopeptide (TPR) repeat protein